MNLYQYVVAVIMGIFLGWLYERTKSLLPCIALHAAYNLACTMLGSSGIKDSEGSFGTFSPFSWVVALLLGAVGMTVLRRVLLLPASSRG
jgi:membrane protease YdiL (CAAX protease family)